MTWGYGDIKSAYEDGDTGRYSHMLVARDSFDYENYPIYVLRGEDPKSHIPSNGDRVDECYSYDLGWAAQSDNPNIQNWEFNPAVHSAVKEVTKQTEVSSGPRTISTLKPSPFGPAFDVEFTNEQGKKASGLVVAVQRGAGHEPVALLLTHQLYKHKAESLLKEYSAKELWVYPIYNPQEWTQVVLPEKEPWHSAQLGDLWELTYSGKKVSAIVSQDSSGSGKLFFIHGQGWVDLNSHAVTEGKLLRRATETD